MAGVAGLPENSNINGCDSFLVENTPAETAVNPSECRTFKFKIKVPQTLDQAAKLRNWLERQRHKTSRPAQNYLSNIVAQCKSIKDEHDLKRVQPMIAWQAERLAGATLG